MRIKSTILVLILLVANILVICGVLCSSLFIQFVMGEFPCPLCMVQRISMMLCACGQVYILADMLNLRRFEWKSLAIGSAITLLSAVMGAISSARHILLHILPGDSGYGSPIMGLHLYSWGMIVFVCEILAIAVLLLMAPRQYSDVPTRLVKPLRAVIVIFIIVVSAFMIGTFIEEGFNWILPDNPVENALFN